MTREEFLTELALTYPPSIVVPYAEHTLNKTGGEWYRDFKDWLLKEGK